MWFKIDDGWAQHSKVRRAGLQGRALWTVAGTMCAARNTNGVVEAHMVKDYVFFAEVNAKKATTALVESGLWHDPESIKTCSRCRPFAGELIPGSFYFHDWLDYQFTKDEALLPPERRKRQRKDALHRNKQLLAQILDRDGTLCRYCSCRVDFRDRRSAAGGTYDHVDPDGPNTLENVVVACRRCNGIKKDRTPEEASMVLLVSNVHQIPISCVSAPVLLTGVRDAGDGAGQNGNGSALGAEQNGTRS